MGQIKQAAVGAAKSWLIRKISGRPGEQKLPYSVVSSEGVERHDGTEMTSDGEIKWDKFTGKK